MRLEWEIERIAWKIERNSTVLKTGCWKWKGKLSQGYGRMRQDGSQARNAHSFSYLAYHGECHNSPERNIDHLCRNRFCVNPLHLELVSRKENILRGNGATAQNARKTKCIRGHEFDSVRKKNGVKFRFCNQCKNISRGDRTAEYRKYYLANKEKIKEKNRLWKLKRKCLPVTQTPEMEE